jgi:UDP-N-acetylmuramoylalanine--D-glutamate ligase
MKYVVYGLGISGISAAKSLINLGFQVICCDDNEDALIKNKEKYPQLTFAKFEEINFDEETAISFAPGIPLYLPKKHKILEIIEKTKAKLACDVEIFYQLNCQKNNFIAITGTNGKSTTTALTGFIFEKLKIPSAIGGNIGIGCFELPQNQENFSYIFETSSYQLDLLSDAHFNIAALLNITPDHLDRHGDMHTYIAAKKRIFKNQNENDFALIGVDNENSREVFLELKNDKNFKAKLIPISNKEVLPYGISLIDGKLFVNLEEKLNFDLKSQFLIGLHNEQNMAFAFAISYFYLRKMDCFANARNDEGEDRATCNDEKNIINAIKEFKGLNHRMQIIGEIDGIKFINDSKATNAESSENALKSFENIFWIVGGKAKDGGISSLKPYFNKVVKAYLIGESSEEFAKFFSENKLNYEKCHDLKTAFKKSLIDAKNSSLSKKNILLSPACASFDQWKNFEERGNYFCELFDGLSKF